MTMESLRYLWRRHRAASIAFALAAALALVFALRFAAFAVYWSDPANRDRKIEGWMTPGYVARSWQVDPALVRKALGGPFEDARRLTIDRIARQTGVPKDRLVADVRRAIAAARAGQ